MSPIVSIDGLSLTFGNRTVVADFSLEIAEGERVTITGPSGSGKSTILRCLVGLGLPRAGEIRIGGETVTGDSIWEIRRRVAYVPQEPPLLGATAREAATLPLRYRANAHIRPNASEMNRLFEALGLDAAVIDLPVSRLSGGEKQRIAIVAALLLRREILLLDEPSSALDERSRERAIAEIEAREGLTVLVAGHDAARFPLGGRTVEL